jgi:hypothetical protein
LRDSLSIIAGKCEVRPEWAFTDTYRGFRIIKGEERVYARTLFDTYLNPTLSATNGSILQGRTVENLVQDIDEHYPRFLRLNERMARFCSRIYLLIWAMIAPLIGLTKMILQPTLARAEPAERSSSVSQLFGESRAFCLCRSWEKYRVGRLAVEHSRAYLEDGVNDLIANLYFAKPRILPVDVLTSSLFVQIYLTALSVLKILPALRVKRLTDPAKLHSYLQSVAHGDYDQILIVARDLYTNYYGLFQDSGQMKQVMVV